MDSRSVLATIPFINTDIISRFTKSNSYSLCNEYLKTDSARDIFESASDSENSFHTSDQIISWIAGMKTKYELSVKRIPLGQCCRLEIYMIHQ